MRGIRRFSDVQVKLILGLISSRWEMMGAIAERSAKVDQPSDN